MNYYERYCGDYGRDTAHLSLAQHGAYTLLLDSQYSTERGLPEPYEPLYRICGALTKAEQECVRAIADAYFPVADDGLRWNRRARRDIADAQPRIAAARGNGHKGGRPRKETHEKPNGFSKETQQESCGNPPRTHSGEASPYPIHQAPNTKNGRSTTLSGKPDLSAETESVFEHWRVRLGHPKARLDEKRRKVVRTRLSEGYSVDELCAAIDGCARSEWHMGKNDRGCKFDDIELICRDAKHVDAFIKIPVADGLSEAGRQTAANLSDWLRDESHAAD